MTTSIDEALVKRLSYLQSRSNLSKSEIANRIGIDRTAYSRIISGERKVSANELAKLASVFGVTTDYLLGNNQTPEWANEKDTNDLADFLKSNEGSMTYQGENLTEEEKEKLEIAMTQIFWKRHKHD